MAFPVVVDPAVPASSDSPGDGDDVIRSLHQALVDLFDLPASITAKIFGLGANADGKVEADMVIKAASPRFSRVIGTEASAADFSWQEDAGKLILSRNTGTEGAPTWTPILTIHPSGDIADEILKHQAFS